MNLTYKHLLDTAYVVRPGECKSCNKPLSSQEAELGLCDLCRQRYERAQAPQEVNHET